MQSVSTEAVLLRLRDASVCVVGSAPELLESRSGAFIDSHDVVIRMNRMPASEHRPAQGAKTSVLTAGRITPHSQFVHGVPECIWWLKQTPNGDRDRGRALQDPILREVQLWSMPHAWFFEIQDDVGAPPSAGIIVLSILARKAQPGRVRVCGVTCWGALKEGSPTSWWKTRGPAPLPHDPEKEAAAFRRLGLVDKGGFHESGA